MTKFKTVSRFAVLLLTLSSLAVYAQLTPRGDAQNPPRSCAGLLASACAPNPPGHRYSLP